MQSRWPRPRARGFSTPTSPWSASGQRSARTATQCAARIAELLGLPIERVSVKATTMEGMGFTGREEGLMAQAVVSVETPI